MIKCEITSQIIELAPGQATDVTLVVYNQTDLIDSFQVMFGPVGSLDVPGLDPLWVYINPNNFSLRPPNQTVIGTDSQQAVSIHIALPPVLEAGTYSSKIVVTSQSAHDTAVIPLSLVVAELTDHSLTIQPAERTSRRRSEIYQIGLANNGNATHRYNLSAQDERDECHFEFVPSEVVLEPGRQANLTLRVRPRQRNLTGSDITHNFSVKLDNFDNQVSASFVQRCAWPFLRWLGQRWKPILLGAGAALVALLAIILFVLPLFAPPKAAFCGPASLRQVRITSNGLTTEIWVSGRAGSEPYTKIATENADILPGLYASLISVSADGRRVVYVTARNQSMDDARLWAIDIENQKKQLLATVPLGLWPTAPFWSADGEQVVFVRRAKAATTAASPAATAEVAVSTPADNVSKLEVWVAKPGEQARKLATPDKFEANLFYGDDSRIMCWSSDNSKVVIRTRPGTTNANLPQTEISMDGSVKQIAVTPLALAVPTVRVNVPTPRLPNISNREVVRDSGTFVNPLDFSKIGLPTASSDSPKAATLDFSKVSPAQILPNQTPANLCATASYSQNDPRWSDRLLKVGEANDMGDFGCAVTAAAILLNYYGIDTDPNDLSNCLGNLTSPLRQQGWLAIGQNCTKNSSRLPGGVRSDFSWLDLDAALQKGPAIVGLLGGQNGTHFVVVTGGSAGVAKTYRVTDPWDGSTYKTLDYFLSRGYKVRWLVTYDGPGSPCTAISTTAADSTGIEVKGVQDGGMYREPQRFDYELISNSTNVSATIKIARSPLNPGDVQPNPLLGKKSPLFDENAVYQVSIFATNSSGLVEASRDFIFTVDNEKPTITHTLNVAPNPKTGKFTVPVTIQLKAQDALTAIAAIEYQINGSEWQLYTSDTTNLPFTVSNNGTYTILYKATDGAGNISEVGTISLTIERSGTTVAPQPSQTPQPTLAPGTTPSPSTAVSVTTAPATTIAVPVVPTQPLPFTQAPATAVPPTATTVPPTATTIAVPNVPTQAFPTTPPPAPSTTTAATTAPVSVATTTQPPVAQLVTSASQITFGLGIASQTISLTNKGAAPLNWNIQPGASSGLLAFNPTSGTIAPGGSAVITINPVNSALAGLQSQTSSFQITSNGGNQTVGVTFSPLPLPTAIFASPSGELALTAVIKLTLVTEGKAAPDHATVSVTFKTCPTCSPTEVVLPAKLNAGNNWSINWDTSTIVPQTGIILRGKLCTSSDDTICTDIPALTNLTISMGAAITAPVAGSQLAPNTTVIVKASGRANHVSLIAVINGVETPLPDQAKASNNWTVNWNTAAITPNSQIMLKGRVCSSIDDSVCQDIDSVGNLTTRLTATVNFSQDLNTNKKLPAKLGVTATASANVNHISLYATFKNSASDATPTRRLLDAVILRPNTAPPFAATWDNAGIPAQTGITLEAQACFTGDENQCTPIGTTFSNLEIGIGTPTMLTVVSGTNQTAIISTTFSEPFKVVVKDGAGNSIAGVSVTFSAPTSGASGRFTGNVTSIAAFTDASGTATSPAFTANATAGSYNVNATAAGITAPAVFALTNTPITVSGITATSGISQTAIINTAFAQPFKVVVKSASGTPVQNATVTFTAPTSGASGTFPEGFTVIIRTTDANGEATAPTFTANNLAGSYQVRANVDGIATPAIFNLTNTNPAPVLNSLSPRHVLPTSATFNLLVDGTNFITFSIVRWNGADRPTTFVSPTRLSAAIPASDVAALGTANISVFNPAPGGGTSATTPFNIALIVGNGTTASCNETDFNKTLAAAVAIGGGTITFDCPNPTTLVFTAVKTIPLNITLEGGTLGAITLSGGNTTGLFQVNDAATFALQNLTLTNGNANAGGGAIVNNGGTIRVLNSRLSNNRSGYDGSGGAIYNNGLLSITNSTLSGNATFVGAGMGNGGAIYNNGTLNISSSTFSDNQTFNSGGAVYNIGIINVGNSTFAANKARNGGAFFSSSATLNLTNSTIAGNNATDNGGGIFVNGGKMTIVNTTIALNSVTVTSPPPTVSTTPTVVSDPTPPTRASGIYIGAAYRVYPVVTIQNTIVANNTGSVNCLGSIDDGASLNNLEFGGAQSCYVGFTVGDPRLGALANNGGSTQTMALGASSAALNTGNGAICTTAPVSSLDQRGQPRTATCDKGAFEAP